MSVVTPFYNTAAYLPECIESVLNQTYGNFEYLLVNNRSTDGSREIALDYAQRDARVRVLDNGVFLEQAANYNHAAKQISPSAKYCKIVQADDALFPDCLRLMVDVAERDPSIGLVSSYYLWGDDVCGEGVSRHEWRLGGRDAVRRMLVGGRFFVGSPTAVLYRADIVRSREPLFPLKRYHEDTDAAYEILLEHDLGFVHQVLTFMRRDNPSITTAAGEFHWEFLELLMRVERFGAAVLTNSELRQVRSTVRRGYFNYLARSLLIRRDREFWRYHREGLATLGLQLRSRDLLPRTLVEIGRLALNPQNTIARLVSQLSRPKPTPSPSIRA